jgi:hypothetical protein
VLARDVARRAPRRRPLRRRIQALGEAWHELTASVADARAIASGALRLLDDPAGDPAVAADAVRAAATAVREIDPGRSREAGDVAREAARRLRSTDTSLGAGVVAHGVVGVAQHALRAAAARDEDRRLATEARNRSRLSIVWKPSRR